MPILKKNYYLFIENTTELNLNLIKKRNKFNIIYRNQNKKEKIKDLLSYRKKCKVRGIKLFVTNDVKLLTKIQADGLYVSAHNKNLAVSKYKIKYIIIGSAHNQKEIMLKKKQGCRAIIYSRIFKTNYKNKKGFLGINRFNFVSCRSSIEIIPLGGINEKNLDKMKTVRCNSFACLSALKKKPAKIINRLF